MAGYSSLDRISPCERYSVKPSAWDLSLDGPISGEENMKRDWKAFESQQDPHSVPAVRLYRWGEPTVSYGRLQSRESAEAFAAGFGARVVQRPTGGGMVFHQSDLSFSIVWRRDHPALPPCIKNVYRLFHEAIANEFRSLGMDVFLHQTEGPRRTFPGACYQEFSQDDILWNGQKWVGGALRVTSWGRLYQGNVKSFSQRDPFDMALLLANALQRGVFLSMPMTF
jgi:lipoate-protein ligase A